MDRPGPAAPQGHAAIRQGPERRRRARAGVLAGRGDRFEARVARGRTRRRRRRREGQKRRKRDCRAAPPSGFGRRPLRRQGGRDAVLHLHFFYGPRDHLQLRHGRGRCGKRRKEEEELEGFLFFGDYDEIGREQRQELLSRKSRTAPPLLRPGLGPESLPPDPGPGLRPLRLQDRARVRHLQRRNESSDLCHEPGERQVRRQEADGALRLRRVQHRSQTLVFRFEDAVDQVVQRGVRLGQHARR